MVLLERQQVKRVPDKWSTVRKGYKTSMIVRQERTEGILLSSGAMAVNWPLEFRKWRRRSFLFHTSANIAGKLYYPSINNVGKPELTEEEGLLRLDIQHRLRNGLLSAKQPEGPISQTGVHAWCKSQSGIFQVRLNHWNKKLFSWHGGSADETTV